jgi:sporulation protein YlmC with PRC-barrel domain
MRYPQEGKAEEKIFIQTEINQDFGACLINFEKLIGMQIVTSEAYVLGEVKGAGVDTDNWRVLNLHVKLTDAASNRLGFKKRFRSSTVSVPVTMVQAVGDLVTIGSSLDDLAKSHEIVEYKA